MAYDETPAQRVRDAVGSRRGISEGRMFGGLAFMLRGNMFVGILEKSLMARVGPRHYDRALASPGAREMDFTGRPMRGYVFVDARGLEYAADLERWVGLCVDYAAKLPANAMK